MGQPTFEEALERFVKRGQDIVYAHYKKNLTNLTPNILEVGGGKKYIKIIAKDGDGGDSKSVWAFINKENGDILKPATWKAPAKHARGNIYDDNPMEKVGPYGPEYLR